MFAERSFPTEQRISPTYAPTHNEFNMPYRRRRSFRGRVRRGRRFSRRRAPKRRVRRSYKRRKKPLPVRNARAIRRLRKAPEVKLCTEDEFPDASGDLPLAQYGPSGKFIGEDDTLLVDSNGTYTYVDGSSGAPIQGAFCPVLTNSSIGPYKQDLESFGASSVTRGTRIGAAVILKSLSCKIFVKPHHTGIGRFRVHFWLVHDNDPTVAYNQDAAQMVNLTWRQFRSMSALELAIPTSTEGMPFQFSYWAPNDRSFVTNAHGGVSSPIWSRFKILQKRTIIMSQGAEGAVPATNQGTFDASNTGKGCKTQAVVTMYLKSPYKIEYPIADTRLGVAPLTVSPTLLAVAHANLEPKYQMPFKGAIRLLMFTEPLDQLLAEDTDPCAVEVQYMTKMRFTDV